MKEKSVKTNAILNVIKSLLSVVFPLITYPYATRVLGVEHLGKVDYGASIITYFSLVATFGITTYAIREGAKVRNNKSDFQKLSCELFTINMVTTVISYLLLFITLFVSIKLHSYMNLILLQSLSIMFTTLGVDWINTVYEDYVYVTIRGIITHVLSLILLFVFVKSQQDYYIYAFLTVLTNAVICLTNLYYCRRYSVLRITRVPHWKLHIKKMAVFFANAVAISIYVSADTTMLGWMKGDYPVGIYAVAVKIYSIMKLILAAIYSVTIPRLSLSYSQKNTDAFFSLIRKISSIIILMLLPMATGIVFYSKEIVLIIAGENFISGGITLSILGVALVFAILGGLMTQCVNVPASREKYNAIATVISAIENVVLNIPFIFLFSQNGAAITTAISEATVLVFCIIKSKDLLKEILNAKISKNIFHSLIGVVIIVALSLILHMMNLNVWITMFLGVGLSIIFYCLSLLLLKNEYIIMANVIVKQKMREVVKR